MKRFGKLEVISFVTGFSLMTFELAAARVLAPTIGSSTYVWTSVIGVIIAALSLGYFAGGLIADKRNHAVDVAWLLILASILVVGTLLTYPDFLNLIVTMTGDARLQAVIAATILFAPASFLLGAISPYLAKLNVRSLKSSGRSVASLSALNSVGGIVGTFTTGFVLFGFIGSRETIALVAVLLLAASWSIHPRVRLVQRALITVTLGVVVFLPMPTVGAERVSIDTASARYEIFEFFYGDQPVRGLATGPGGIQSAVALSGSNEPVFWYAKAVSRITLEEKPKSILILGGGAFTLPEYLAEELPSSTIDVVEIDPELKRISEEYFRYSNPKNVNLIFTDARTYVNQTDKTYDLVIADVYGDANIPFSLITKEYGQALAGRVKEDGMVLANVIAGTVGPCRAVFDAAAAAYGQGFSYAYYTNKSGAPEKRDNYIMIYTRDELQGHNFKRVPPQTTSAYTDNYSPSERLYYDCEASKE